MSNYTLIYSGKFGSEHIFFAISNSDMFRIDIDVSSEKYSIGVKKMESIAFLETARVVGERLSLIECINLVLAIVKDLEKKDAGQSNK